VTVRGRRTPEFWAADPSFFGFFAESSQNYIDKKAASGLYVSIPRLSPVRLPRWRPQTHYVTLHQDDSLPLIAMKPILHEQ